MDTADEQVPIWQVIEEFKDKIKVQEQDLKKRREELDVLDRKLREEERTLHEVKRQLEEKDEILMKRDSELGQREEAATRKERDLQDMEAELAGIEKQFRTDRAMIDKRQAQLVSQESELSKLLEATVTYETKAKDSMLNVSLVEEKLLLEETNLRKSVEDANARREELLAKSKVLSEQSEAMANNKRLMIEQQKRLVEWERNLAEREKAINEHVTFKERHSSVMEEVAPSRSPVREEANAAALEAAVREAPQLHSVPAPVETEPMPDLKPKHQKAVVKEMPKEVPKVEEKKVSKAEINCPSCKTIIDAESETCWACGAKVEKGRPFVAEEIVSQPVVHEVKSEVAHHVEEVKAEEPVAAVEAEHTADVKKSVSIRKIIKRK